MSREAREVPPNWEHPRRENGSFIGLSDWDFDKMFAEYEKGRKEWEAGNFPAWASEEDKKLSYEDWEGGPPNKEHYMPKFEPGTATHLMMYETTSEGTPISPAFKTPEELAQWLVDNNASAFADQTASYDAWLRTIKSGWAPSAIFIPGQGLISGVEAHKDIDGGTV
jgi:hypothetical protein